MLVGMFQAQEMFSLPVLVIANFYVVEALQAPAPLPYRHGKPKFSLIVLEAIAVDPTSSQRKLDIIKQHQTVSLQGFKEKSGPREEIWLVASDDHGIRELSGIRDQVSGISLSPTLPYYGGL
jgi:hypothetical protein